VGKFTAGVVDTSGKFATSVVDTGRKFATLSLIQVVQLDLRISLRIFQIIFMLFSEA
jgi:hypothetical protein